MKLTFHPVAELFPLLEGEEFDRLAADISTNGLLEPIWIHPEDGRIVDGRNRYRACQKVNVEPKTRPWSGKGSLVEFVVSLNLLRRHLNKSQCACVSTDMIPMLEAEAKRRQAHGQTAPGKTLSAKMRQALGKSTHTQKTSEVIQTVSDSRESESHINWDSRSASQGGFWGGEEEKPV